jgi:UDP-2,3-diacylglucosamine pyrophosphatase LpxH
MILVLSDLHIGANEHSGHRKNLGTPEEVENVFKAVDQEVDTLIITGDLFESRCPADKLKKFVDRTFSIIDKKMRKGTTIFYIATDHDTLHDKTNPEKNYLNIIKPAFIDILGLKKRRQIIDKVTPKQAFDNVEIRPKQVFLTIKDKRIMFMHGKFGKPLWKLALDFEAARNPITDKLSQFWVTRIWDNSMKLLRDLSEKPEKREQNQYARHILRVLKKEKIKVSAVFFGHIHRPFITRKKSKKKKPLMVSLGSWGLFPVNKTSPAIRTFATISDDLKVNLYSLNYENGGKPMATGAIL